MFEERVDGRVRRYYTLTRQGREAELAATKRYPLLSRLIPDKLGKTV